MWLEGMWDVDDALDFTKCKWLFMMRKKRGGVKRLSPHTTGVTSGFCLTHHLILVCILKKKINKTCFPSKSKSHITSFENAVGERDETRLWWSEEIPLLRIRTSGGNVLEQSTRRRRCETTAGEAKHPQVLDVLWYSCYFHLLNKHHYFGQVSFLFFIYEGWAKHLL